MALLENGKREKLNLEDIRALFHSASVVTPAAIYDLMQSPVENGLMP